jgi:transmembrane sensor
MQYSEQHWRMLVRFFRREATPEEMDQIDAWRKSSDLNQKTFDEFFSIHKSLTAARSDDQVSVSRGWENFSRGYDQRSVFEKRQQRKKYWFAISRYAAAVFIGIIISTGLLYFGQNQDALPNETIMVEVPNSQRSTVTLFDGTRVVLNSGSRFEYIGGSENERRVKVYGEAYFEVQENKELPFIVETEYFSVRVLGTVFNVKSYESENEASALLLEGDIELLLPGQPMVQLSPGQRAVMTPGGELDVEHVLDAHRQVAWRNGKYYFENEELSSIALMLERAFDVEIVFENESIKQARYTGSLNVDEHVRDVMQRLKLTSTFELKYRIKGKTIYVNT